MAPASLLVADDQDASPPQGTLFRGIRFWIAQRVPSRTHFVDEVRMNGGQMVPLEKNADILIADHLRHDCPLDSYSYTWIEKSIAEGELQDKDNHRAGPSRDFIRPIGSLKPAKTGRNPYSAGDDRALYDWVIDHERKGGKILGNEIYKQFEQQNSRHPWQSWRDRWVKHLSRRAPPPSAARSPPPFTSVNESTLEVDQARNEIRTESGTLDTASLPHTKRMLRHPVTDVDEQEEEANRKSIPPQTALPPLRKQRFRHHDGDSTSEVDLRPQKRQRRDQHEAAFEDEHGIQISMAMSSEPDSPFRDDQPSSHTDIDATRVSRDAEVVLINAEHASTSHLLDLLRGDSRALKRQKIFLHEGLDESVEVEFVVPNDETLGFSNADLDVRPSASFRPRTRLYALDSSRRDSILLQARWAKPKPFTDEQRLMLFDMHMDVEQCPVGSYKKLWLDLATVSPDHTAIEWKEYYENEVLPHVEKSIEEAQSANIDTVVDNRVSNSAGEQLELPVTVPGEHIDEKLRASSQAHTTPPPAVFASTQQSVPSSRASDTSFKQSFHAVVIPSPSPQQRIDYAASPHIDTIKEEITSPRGERFRPAVLDAEKEDHGSPNTGGEQPPDNILVQRSQQVSSGMADVLSRKSQQAPEANIEVITILDSDDEEADQPTADYSANIVSPDEAGAVRDFDVYESYEIPEGEEENVIFNASGSPTFPRHHVRVRSEDALIAFGDHPMGFKLLQGGQSSEEEWHDISILQLEQEDLAPIPGELGEAVAAAASQVLETHARTDVVEEQHNQCLDMLAHEATDDDLQGQSGESQSPDNGQEDDETEDDAERGILTSDREVPVNRTPLVNGQHPELQPLESPEQHSVHDEDIDDDDDDHDNDGHYDGEPEAYPGWGPSPTGSTFEAEETEPDQEQPASISAEVADDLVSQDGLRRSFPPADDLHSQDDLDQSSPLPSGAEVDLNMDVILPDTPSNQLRAEMGEAELRHPIEEDYEIRQDLTHSLSPTYNIQRAPPINVDTQAIVDFGTLEDEYLDVPPPEDDEIADGDIGFAHLPHSAAASEAEDEDDGNENTESPAARFVHPDTQAILDANTQPLTLDEYPHMDDRETSNDMPSSPPVISSTASRFQTRDRLFTPVQQSSRAASTASSLYAGMDPIDAFKTRQRALGSTEDDIDYALARATLDSRLAAQVLDSLRRGKGVPTGVPGIWTEEEDDILTSSNAADMSRLERKHGKRAYDERVDLLQLNE